MYGLANVYIAEHRLTDAERMILGALNAAGDDPKAPPQAGLLFF